MDRTRYSVLTDLRSFYASRSFVRTVVEDKQQRWLKVIDTQYNPDFQTGGVLAGEGFGS